MLKTKKKQISEGHEVYSKMILYSYDFVVLFYNNTFFWKCPTKKLLEFYNKNVTSNHLDVGVGSGFFLDRCKFPEANPRLCLMDLNMNTLDITKKRIERYNPEVYTQNILEPIEHKLEGFDSIGINYLLHCLPGDIESKSVVFENLKPLLYPDGTIFGSTILGKGLNFGKGLDKKMKLYNDKKIFTNLEDDAEGLERALEKHFSKYTLEVVGCVAIFTGKI